MPDLFNIICVFLDDTNRAQGMKDWLRERYKFWSDGCQIFSKDETAIEILADLFDRLGAQEVCTGYSDPKKAITKWGSNDPHTGYYYLEVRQ